MELLNLVLELIPTYGVGVLFVISSVALYIRSESQSERREDYLIEEINRISIQSIEKEKALIEVIKNFDDRFSKLEQLIIGGVK